ncbi:MAG: biotin--[acetyl-CoA-carboxylase] ligase [Anaerolineaceae bacterium]
MFREVLDSTMVLARREADEGASHGTLVLAEEQTAGKGRKGRAFYSPRGENLYLTIVLRCPFEVHKLLPLAVPLAVCLGVAAQGVDAAIKWPNDVWVAGRKLSGMLIDAELSSTGGLAMVGIGINVNGDPTTIPEIAAIATSMRNETGRHVPREALLAAVCNELEAALRLSPGALVERYRAASLVIGKEVWITPVTGEAYAGVAESVADDGSLMVVDAQGGRRPLSAEEVTLRPFGGVAPL